MSLHERRLGAGPRGQLFADKPVTADADVRGERGLERERVDHLLADELLDRRDLDLGHLEQQLVVDLQHEPAPRPSSRSRRCTRSIASLMMSAAVPWITELTASRSPSERTCQFAARSSGIGRRRPSIVTE